MPKTLMIQDGPHDADAEKPKPEQKRLADVQLHCCTSRLRDEMDEILLLNLMAEILPR